MPEILDQFGSYTFRSVDESDRVRLTDWIAWDPAHAGVMSAEFFMGLRRNPEGKLIRDSRPTCLALEDSGGLLFYIRVSRAARTYIQFSPDNSKNRGRVSLGLLKGMAFLEVGLGHAGVEQWIFETRETRLKKLAGLRLGFRESPDEMVRPIYIGD